MLSVFAHCFLILIVVCWDIISNLLDHQTLYLEQLFWFACLCGSSCLTCCFHMKGHSNTSKSLHLFCGCNPVEFFFLYVEATKIVKEKFCYWKVSHIIETCRIALNIYSAKGSEELNNCFMCFIMLQVAVEVFGLVQQLLPSVAILNQKYAPPAFNPNQSTDSTTGNQPEQGLSACTTSNHYAVIESEHPYKPACVTHYKVSTTGKPEW